jgi:phage baseplate assembly protein W
MSTPFDRPLYGFRFAETRRGDTLQDIASRELGDAARWPELIAYNKLSPPFLVDEYPLATEGVAVTGQLLLVPAPAPVAVTTDPVEVFQVDMGLARDGSLVVDGGDFGTVAGLDNFEQAIKNAISTDRGELIFHARYGSLIRRLVGKVNRPTTALLGAQYARSAIKDDPRVNLVKRSVATSDGNVVNVAIEVEAVNGRSTLVNASV